MLKNEFNDVISNKWPDLYWVKRFQYTVDNTRGNGNIDTSKFMVGIYFCNGGDANEILFNSDDVAFETTLERIVEYIKKNEDMIPFWIL